MSRWRKIVENILLEDKYDLSSFSINDIASFSESCKKASLKENNLDEQMKELVNTFHDYVREGMFKLDEKRGILITIIDTIPIIVIHDSNRTISGGYDCIENCIYLFVDSFSDLKKPETEIALGHELDHYLKLHNLPVEERKKHISYNKSESNYYTDPIEFNAYKRGFIDAAEYLLFKNNDLTNIETEHKKLPKKNVYDFFKYVETGKLPLYTKWFNTLDDQQKKELLDDMLHKFAESIENNGKLALRESYVLYNFYKGLE